MDDIDRFGPKFVCDRVSCTVRPTPPFNTRFCDLSYHSPTLPAAGWVEIGFVFSHSRRYRLFAQHYSPFHQHHYHYAVRDEQACDGILIAISGENIVTDNEKFGVPRKRNWYRPQELFSGDLIFIPGEKHSFRVHLYGDDFIY